MQTVIRSIPIPFAAIFAGCFSGLIFTAAAILFSPLIGAIIVLSLAFGMLVVFFEPRIAYLLMALVVPIERLGRFGDDLDLESISLMRLVGLLALAAVCVQFVMRRQKLELSSSLILLGLLQTLAFCSIFYARDIVATQSHALTMLGTFLMFFVIVQGVRDWAMVEGLILTWLFSTLMIGIYQIYGWHFSPDISEAELGDIGTRFGTTLRQLSEVHTLGESRRAVGTTSNAAVYGINLLLSLPFFFLYLRLAKNPIIRFFWMLAVAIIVYNSMLTNTRAVLVALLILLGMILASGLFRMTAVAFLFGAAGVMFLLDELPQSIWQRILNPNAYSLENATNLSWRFDLWSGAFKLGLENWLGGVGVGNRTAIISKLDLQKFDATWIMAHNEYLQVFYELGAMGILVFLGFLATTVYAAFTTSSLAKTYGLEPRKYWIGVASWLTLVIGMLFALQVDAFHFPLKGWWLIAGLSVVTLRLARQEAAEILGGRNI